MFVRQIYFCLHFKSNLCLDWKENVFYMCCTHIFTFCKKGFTHRYWSNPIFFVKGLKEIHKNVFLHLCVKESQILHWNFYLKRYFVKFFTHEKRTKICKFLLIHTSILIGMQRNYNLYYLNQFSSDLLVDFRIKSNQSVHPLSDVMGQENATLKKVNNIGNAARI